MLRKIYTLTRKSLVPDVGAVRVGVTPSPPGAHLKAVANVAVQQQTRSLTLEHVDRISYYTCSRRSSRGNRGKST